MWERFQALIIALRAYLEECEIVVEGGSLVVSFVSLVDESLMHELIVLVGLRFGLCGERGLVTICLMIRDNTML